jgi:hypothetical protein
MKSTRAETEKRVAEVLNLRLLGAEFRDIKAHVEQAGWKVRDRQLWRYIRKGDRLLARTLEKDTEKLVNRHVAQRRGLYARAMAVSDYGTALRVLQDEAKLLSLYPEARSQTGSKRDSTQVNVQVNVGSPTIEDQRRQLDGVLELLAQLGALPAPDTAPEQFRDTGVSASPRVPS